MVEGDSALVHAALYKTLMRGRAENRHVNKAPISLVDNGTLFAAVVLNSVEDPSSAIRR